ncbi:MAG: TlpA family protein disulfide reductase [Bacteroidetes bacterium]|nr:TlpA family protein disulfide reductase [Bacteroidota bacterium]
MKRFLLFILANFVAICAFNQTLIENPKFTANSADNVFITKIELQDTCTVLHFRITDPPGKGFNLPKESFIQVVNGEKLYVNKAEGVEIGGSFVIPESGEIHYQLYFPKIDKSTALIDFGEGETGTWFIYDLELIPQTRNSLFPSEIEGNWFRTDGSMEWVYGLFNGKVIYDSEVYSQTFLSAKDNGYELKAQKGGKVFCIFMKPGFDNQLLIGLEPDKLETFAREPNTRKDFKLADDKGFDLPIIKSGTAIYKGYINGFLPRMGQTGMIYVSQIIENDQKSYLIPINDDGTFEVEIPLSHPHSIYVQITGGMNSIFLEPGKTVFHCIDLSRNSRIFKPNSLLVMGECARINTELQLLDHITSYSYYLLGQTLQGTSNEDFKKLALDTMNQQMESFELYSKNNPLSKKAKEFFQMHIPINAYGGIVSYTRPMLRRGETPPELPDDQFFHFISSDIVNNPLSLVSGGTYDGFTNRLFFADFMRTGWLNTYKKLKETLKERGIPISENEKIMLDKLADGEKVKAKDLGKEIEDSWIKFTERNKDLTSALSLAMYNETEIKNLLHYTGVKDGFMMDLHFSQFASTQIEGSMKPMTEEARKVMDERVSNNGIRDYLLNMSKEMEEKIAAKKKANKTKLGYIVHENPKVPKDSIFESIVSTFPGKVLFIDYWATWCSPCRSGIERMEPLKKEYADKDVEFVYITSPSSPLDTYNLMVPDIKGQHFRLSTDEWRYLTSRFEISGIPRYMLLDKKGNIVSEKLTEAHSNEALRKIIDKHLE